MGLVRRLSIILPRLRIGHTYFTHKYLMASGAERQVPRCSSCHVDFTVKHILIECRSYQNFRNNRGLHDKSLVEILGEDAPWESIMRFLKDIDLFYKI